MKLAVSPPLKPMLAKRTPKLPPGEDWLFEPKWDGFRCMVFRDGDEMLLQSRDLKPLDRYFVELDAPLKEQLPHKFVGDGELVIATDKGLDFEALQMRIHPAASRVEKLSKEIPASLVLWDLLCVGDEDLTKTPFAERRERLEHVLADAAPPLFVTPITRDRVVAADWFERFEGAGFDGVMAKQIDGVYQPNKRTMLKVKHQRTADCVVAGYRWHKNGPGTMVGSLLLALYDDEGVLHHIGVAASFKESRRKELVEELAPYREGAEESHPWFQQRDEQTGERRPGGHSRWSQGKDFSFVPLRPELVVEVTYDHMQGTRLRHTAHFKRWRKDKPASECTYGQLDTIAPEELSKIFKTGR